MHNHKLRFFFIFSGRATDCHSKEYSVARMIVVITIAFIILNIPYVLFSCTSIDSSGSFLYSYGFFMVVTIDRLCTGCNMLVNLLTYSIMSRIFRNTVKEVLACDKGLERSDTIQGTSNMTENISVTAESRA